MNAAPPVQPPPRPAATRDRDILVATVGIGGLGTFSMHAVLPALPAIRAWFGAPLHIVQLLISLAVLTTALGNLLAGPLSDRFGRRRVVLGALGIFCAATALAAFAPSMGWLLAIRIVQSFAGGAAMAVARAALNDHFPHDRVARAIAYVAMAILVVPMFAPTIGGAVVQWLDWRANFTLLSVLGTLVLSYYALRVPETLRQPRARAGGYLRSFAALLRMPAYLRLALYAASMTSAVYALIAGGPHVAIDLMGATPAAYGLYFMLPALGSLGGFALASRITHRVHRETLMRNANRLAIAGVAIMAALWAFGVHQPLALLLPAGLVFIANSVATPAVMSAAMGLRRDLAGAASGLLGFAQLAIAAAATQAVAAFASDSAWPLIATMATCVLAAFIGLRWLPSLRAP